MKTIGNIVILGLLAAIAYLMLNGSLKKDGDDKQAAAAERNKLDRLLKQAEATPAPALIPQVTKAQLVVVRGIVAAVPDGAGGLVITGDPSNPESVRLPPGAGLADHARVAQMMKDQMMMDQMNRQWGSLLVFDHGAWRAVNWNLPLADGQVLLKGLPNAATMVTGNKVNVVAAPLPELYQRMRVVTAQFNLVGQ